MASDGDLTTILVLFGLGYLVLKSRRVAEAITAEVPSVEYGLSLNPIYKFSTALARYFTSPRTPIKIGGYSPSREE